MSLTCVRGLAVAALLAAAPVAWSQDLDRILARDEIARQKLVADVNTALAQARTLEKSDPAKGVDILRKAQSQLQNDGLLPQRQKEGLLQQVAVRLNQLNELVRVRRLEQDLAAQKEADKPGGPTKKYDFTKPSSATTIANDFISSAKGQLQAADRRKFLQQHGVNATLGEVENSAAQMEERRITERFIRLADLRKPKLDPREAAVLKALNSVMTVDFTNARFKEVIEELQRRTEQAIILDEGSLKEVMAEYDSPVDFKVTTKVQVKTILRAILGNLGLTYVIKEGTIQVVSLARARDMAVVRTYNVEDLVTPNPQLIGTPLGQMMGMMNAQSLINVIMQTVDPQLWQEGKGSITYYPPTNSLIIRAPAEVHYMLPLGIGR